MNQEERLWPLGTPAALLAAVIIWFGVALTFVATGTYLGWPDDNGAKYWGLGCILTYLVTARIKGDSTS